MRSLGLDIGDRRIGVALSDSGNILASPFSIIERRDEQQDIEAILKLIDQHQVARIIVGLPRSLSGGEGEQADKVRAFVEKLRIHTPVPSEFRDERLTTVSAQRLMQAARTKKARRKADDAIAAALILQGYLDEGR